MALTASTVVSLSVIMPDFPSCSDRQVSVVFCAGNNSTRPYLETALACISEKFQLKTYDGLMCVEDLCAAADLEIRIFAEVKKAFCSHQASFIFN